MTLNLLVYLKNNLIKEMTYFIINILQILVRFFISSSKTLFRQIMWINFEIFYVSGIILQHRYPEIHGQNIWIKLVTKKLLVVASQEKNSFVFWVIFSDFSEQLFLLSLLNSTCYFRIRINYREGFFGRVSFLHHDTISC